MSEIVFEILELAVALGKVQTSGKVQQGLSVADILVQIAQKVDRAYELQTGKALDPSLIKPEDLI